MAWIAIMAAEMSLAFLGGDAGSAIAPVLNVIVAFLIVEVTDLRKKIGK